MGLGLFVWMAGFAVITIALVLLAVSLNALPVPGLALARIRDLI